MSTSRPIGFAHRGARLAAAENTLEAFGLALDAGAPGLETDCWLAADGEVVCAHDPTVGRGRRRRRIAESSAADLETLGVPRLADVFARLGNDFELSIDAKHDEVLDPLLAVVETAGAIERLWLCHPEHEVLAGLRARTAAHLVHSRLRGTLAVPVERHAHDLSRFGIEAMNFHHSEWTAGLVSLFHRFGLRAFAWDAQEERHLRAMVRIGIDALYCDRPERLVAVLGHAAGGGVRGT
jgi:glycerophosphoryl diester phosphodiesterase